METEYLKKESPKILIVDDISINVEILENILSNEGYEVLGALSVEEAINIMKKTLPSLILSDLSMPEIDGLEFCRMVKSNPKTRDIPFVFISVLDTSEEKERAFLSGAVDYIPKPFDAVEVVMRVNNHLNSYRLQQEMASYNRMMHKLVEEQKKQIEREQENRLRALAKIMEKRNKGMGNRLENLGHNAKLLAQSLQLLPSYENEISDEFVETIEVASMLYDIGSLVIPDITWAKGNTDDISDTEYIKRHITEGAEILEEISSGQGNSRFLSMAIKIVKYHHTHWDGTGYPALRERDIPLEARITSLAITFDALTGKENNDNAYSVEESIQIINEKGGRVFDPDIVRVFGKIWRQMKTP